MILKPWACHVRRVQWWVWCLLSFLYLHYRAKSVHRPTGLQLTNRFRIIWKIKTLLHHTDSIRAKRDSTECFVRNQKEEEGQVRSSPAHFSFFKIERLLPLSVESSVSTSTLLSSLITHKLRKHLALWPAGMDKSQEWRYKYLQYVLKSNFLR